MLPRALPLSLNLSLSRRGRALKPFNYSGGGISAIKQSAAAVKEEGERGNYLIPTIFGRTPRKRGGEELLSGRGPFHSQFRSYTMEIGYYNAIQQISLVSSAILSHEIYQTSVDLTSEMYCTRETTKYHLVSIRI